MKIHYSYAPHKQGVKMTPEFMLLCLAKLPLETRGGYRRGITYVPDEVTVSGSYNHISIGFCFSGTHDEMAPLAAAVEANLASPMFAAAMEWDLYRSLAQTKRIHALGVAYDKAFDKITRGTPKALAEAQICALDTRYARLQQKTSTYYGKFYEAAWGQYPTRGYFGDFIKGLLPCIDRARFAGGGGSMKKAFRG